MFEDIQDQVKFQDVQILSDKYRSRLGWVEEHNLVDFVKDVLWFYTKDVCSKCPVVEENRTLEDELDDKDHEIECLEGDIKELEDELNECKRGQ